ncbi:helix-turn-helix domain-containing protein [Wenyingzhuangia aestuarii]|uniref:helix-turn-helix domain-containing protein n=1 Tax=Wenyingzhuangia aestuarii TaxID=1647582 RepID=UPI00143CB975|nr:AraC family transcriptional regulator [Wenyingzhuangia aestuarii]NJB81533.1 AraC-like DNA-binding protein [Wenyingzhuangia aestuarii]
MALIILIPGFNFISNTINLLGGSANAPFLYGSLFFFVQGTSMLFAPLVFYYTSLMCGKKVKLTYGLFWVTGLIICYNFYQFLEFFSLPENLKIQFLEGLKNEEFPMGQLVINLLFIIMQQVYFTIAAIRVFKFKNKIKDVFSTRSTLKVGFVQNFITLVWVLNIISLILYATIPMYLVEYIVLPLVIICINFFIVYFAFEYRVIFNKDTYAIFLKDLKLLDLNNIQDSKIEISKRELHANDIMEFLKSNKTYLNPDYTIFDLAKDLNTSQQLVSSIINKEMQQSFSRLINHYRVEESKVLLKEKSDTITIEAISELSGFKSRASFYRAFKNETQQTPSQYLS